MRPAASEQKESVHMSTACPICGSYNVQVIYQVSAEEAAYNWIVAGKQRESIAELAAHIRVLWGREIANMMDCLDCTFGFSDPFVAGDAKFYELAFGPSNYPRDKWEYRKTLSALKSFPVNGRALEIGSGYGFFLEKISPHFFAPSQVTAIEYNNIAIEKLKNKGYRVLSCDPTELLESNESYDAIFMFQILEHRDKIHETFSALHGLLNRHGNLFIAVPSPSSIRFWERNGGIMDYPPNHIGFWNCSNLEDMALRFGFSVSEIAVEPFRFFTFAKWDVFFSYVRRAQKGEFIAKKLYRNRRSGIGRYLNLAALIVLAPSRVPVWIKALFSGQSLAPHYWIHLTKN
jgi:SAM-dependent methyltransferase